MTISILEKPHARFSPSQMERWSVCTASLTYIEELKAKGALSKEKSSSVYADEGTLAHYIAEKCLRENELPQYYLNCIYRGIQASQEMIDYVGRYIEYIESVKGEGSICTYEKEVHLAEECFGTCDTAVYNPESRELHVIDLKYGKGVSVSAVENKQLAVYALGVFNSLGYPIEKIFLHIYQPRINNISVWEISPKKLRIFERYLKKSIDKCLSDYPDFKAGEKQCRWCPAKGHCKSAAEYAFEKEAKMFDDLDKISSNEITDKELEDYYSKMDFTTAFFNAIKIELEKRMLKGNKFEKYKLVVSKGRKKWNDEAEGILANMLGEKAYVKKLISQTEAKRLGIDITELVIAGEDKPLIAPFNDKREDYFCENNT